MRSNDEINRVIDEGLEKSFALDYKQPIEKEKLMDCAYKVYLDGKFSVETASLKTVFICIALYRMKIGKGTKFKVDFIPVERRKNAK